MTCEAHLPFEIRDEDLVLNDLLSRWHAWASDWRTALGFPTEAAFAHQYRTSRQHDDGNGALDQDVDNIVMAGVDGCINAIEQPWRNALQINARNLHTGVAVWRSPRLPKDELARALLVSDARALLLKELRARALL